SVGVYSIHLAGESKKNRDGTSRQAEIKRCSEGEPVQLVREPNNPYDRNAILVLSARGRGIGYISAEQCVWIAELIDKGRDCRAEIECIIGGEPGKPSVGVILQVMTA